MQYVPLPPNLMTPIRTKKVYFKNKKGELKILFLETI